MDLEFLMRRTPLWREIARGILFQDGDVVEHGEESEARATEEGDSGEATGAGRGSGSLGIGAVAGSVR
jgi:hypothetical protein